MENIRKRSRAFLHSKQFIIAKAIALAIFPLILLLLPVTAFDSGPELCLFTRLSGFHCPGCGMTRGCMHLIHFDYVGAWRYNKLSYVVLPIMCGLLIVEYVKSYKQLRQLKKEEA